MQIESAVGSDGERAEGAVRALATDGVEGAGQRGRHHRGLREALQVIGRAAIARGDYARAEPDTRRGHNHARCIPVA